MVNWIKKLFIRVEKKEPTSTLDFLEPFSEDDIFQIGRDAEEALKNQAFIVAFNKYEKILFTAWRNSTPLQTKEREAVWHRLEALHEVKIILNGMVNNMIAERKALEEAKKLKGEK